MNESFIIIIPITLSIILHILVVKELGEINEKIYDLKKSTHKDDLKLSMTQRRNLQSIINGLPNLFKDDLDMVQKVDYPQATNRVLSVYIDSEEGLFVTFKGEGIKAEHLCLSKARIRAAEIRKIQEKCCPKKGKKK